MHAPVVAGIQLTVYGLDQVRRDVDGVVCLWLLHGRFQSQKTMASLARRAVAECGDDGARGVIAVAFDQRNHGSRLVDRVRNECWAGRNPCHAQDMYSIYRTARAAR